VTSQPQHGQKINKVKLKTVKSKTTINSQAVHIQLLTEHINDINNHNKTRKKTKETIRLCNKQAG